MKLDDSQFILSRRRIFRYEPLAARYHFAGITLITLAEIVGVAAGLTGIAATIYSLVAKPSGASVSAGATAAQNKIIANLQSEVAADQQKQTALEAQIAADKKTQTIILAGAGAVVLFLVLRKK
jgi:hypothetical protein